MESKILDSMGLTLKSSQPVIDSALRQSNIFRRASEYVKDVHFERYVLAPLIQNDTQLNQFLNELDADSAQRDKNSVGCTKASIVRNWIKKYRNDSVFTQFQWAIRGLSRARRTCCSCHQTGSFAESKTHWNYS